MKPKLTPIYAMLNVLLSLTLVATVLYQGFTSGLEWGLIAILSSGPLFVISIGLLNSQFASQDEEHSRGRYSQSEDDACTTKTKENDKDI